MTKGANFHGTALAARRIGNNPDPRNLSVRTPRDDTTDLPFLVHFVTILYIVTLVSEQTFRRDRAVIGHKRRYTLMLLSL